MTGKNRKKPDNVLLVDYEALGTVSIKELGDAFNEDVHALEELYRVRFVTAGRLYLPVTNQYGEPRRIIHPEGHNVDRIDTHHFRPACMDYDI